MSFCDRDFCDAAVCEIHTSVVICAVVLLTKNFKAIFLLVALLLLEMRNGSSASNFEADMNIDMCYVAQKFSVTGGWYT